MRSNLMSGLVHFLLDGECEAVVLGVTAPIDGLWLDLALQSAGLTARCASPNARLSLSSAVRRRPTISGRPLSLHEEAELRLRLCLFSAAPLT
ncbi:hypothetical protein QO004_000967 [Rhizobium mesoamericanum]|uniref:hypothetical protein n=1 Tax=Rhizobium mesoamericanum TaxID=1079800 RepID=UPI00278B9DE4|nr:hypothetical protein [Rhizobium mesoamericanum]MDQ0559189.1 hypothetical protein [Rhizobium mesoamericanum]